MEVTESQSVDNVDIPHFDVSPVIRLVLSTGDFAVGSAQCGTPGSTIPRGNEMNCELRWQLREIPDALRSAGSSTMESVGSVQTAERKPATAPHAMSQPGDEMQDDGDRLLQGARS